MYRRWRLLRGLGMGQLWSGSWEAEIQTGQFLDYGSSKLQQKACDKTATEETYHPLIETLTTTHPNTKIIPYPFNVAKEDETLVLIDEVLNAFGRLDVWVCSSGLLGPPSIHETTADDLQKCFEAHSLAPFFALKHAPAAMGKMRLVSDGEGGYANAAP